MPKPAPPPARQGRAYSREELHNLLRRALQDLMADGTPFREITVEQIISRVRIARSTFYMYFEDKSAMLRALSLRSLARLYQGPEENWVSKGAEATREDIVAGMRALLDTYLEDEVVIRAVSEAAVYDRSIREAYFVGIEDYARAVAGMIRAGRRAGAMREVEPVETAEALTWMCERTISQLAADASPARRDAIAESLADVVWRVLFP